jgi:hypothetical protein
MCTQRVSQRRHQNTIKSFAPSSDAGSTPYQIISAVNNLDQYGADLFQKSQTGSHLLRSRTCPKHCLFSADGISNIFANLLYSKYLPNGLGLFFSSPLPMTSRQSPGARFPLNTLHWSNLANETHINKPPPIPAPM